VINIKNLDHQYAYKISSLRRGNDGTIKHTCNIPYKSITIDMNSNCFLCYCDGYLPIPVGKVSDFNSIEEVMNSTIAKQIQDDVTQKKFTYCATDNCGIKYKSQSLPSFKLFINIDESCNLSCASCRREILMLKQGDIFETKLKDLKRIISWLEKFNEPITIVMSGNGDPLASNILRPLIKDFSPEPNQYFEIFTNGLLVKKHLAESEIFKKIKEMVISVDAGSKDVYEDVRSPGKWNVLMDNLEFLSNSINKNKIVLKFALQKRNHNDINNFVDLVERLGFKGIIHELNDWGTWNYYEVETPDAWTIVNGTYLEHDVLKSNHVLYNKTISTLKNITSKKVELSTMIRDIINAE